MYSTYIWCIFLVISSDGKSFRSFALVIIFSVGAGMSTISDGLDTYIFLLKDGNKQYMKGKMDGKMFIYRQSRHFSFIDNMIKVLFPICTLNCRVNNYVSRQRKGINRRNERTFIVIL